MILEMQLPLFPLRTPCCLSHFPPLALGTLLQVTYTGKKMFTFNFRLCDEAGGEACWEIVYRRRML